MTGVLEKSARDLTEKCTVKNAKKIAFPLLAVILSLHGINYYLNGSDTCNILLTNGHYISEKVWQPKGCMMHLYKPEEIGSCLQNRHVSFVGDSRIRQHYYRLITQLTSKPVPNTVVHSDLSHMQKDTNTYIEFLWQPHINDSTVALYKSWSSGVKPKPNIIVHSAALWAIKDFNGAFDTVEKYKANLTKVLPYMEKLVNEPDVDIVWMLQAPVQELLLSESRKSITNIQVDIYNDVAYALFQPSDIQVWQSVRKTAYFSKFDSLDGLHLPDDVIDTNIQLLLNWLCNNDIDPSDATCCKGLPFPLTFQQKWSILFFICCFIGALYFGICVKKKHTTRSAQNVASNANDQMPNGQLPNRTVVKDVEKGIAVETNASEELYNVMVALSKFGIIMAYFYICDRTDLLPKMQKHFSFLQFFVAFTYVAVIGFFFDKETKQPTMLNRDQTDEWKGWMQLVILIYHMTGASTVLPIYMHVRVLVAMYLFQTGYGHFSFFWRKQEFGIVRICQVLFRLNFLVFFLCLVMDRPYQFYYFVPLVSFWFVVVYVVMVIPPRTTVKSAAEHQSHYLIMVLKLTGLFTLCVIIAFSEVLFYNIFNWWPMIKLFAWPANSLHEWWFRWELDRYIVGYGMCFSFAYISLNSMGKIKDNNPTNLFRPVLTVIAIIASFISIGVYSYHAFTCPTKPECNKVHTVLSIFPITGFILLRNVPGYFRTKYSNFFAWFGKISLELFIGQYHIWLANDTKGILVLIPHYPTLNALVSLFIFICVAHEITNITTIVTKWAVPNNAKIVLKRLFLFCAMLVLLLIASM